MITISISTTLAIAYVIIGVFSSLLATILTMDHPDGLVRGVVPILFLVLWPVMWLGFILVLIMRWVVDQWV